MIVTKLSGGLGNQIFQYAIGRKLSIQNDTDLVLDISHYADDTKRKYALYVFNIKAQTIDKMSGHIFLDYNEKQFSFDPEVLKIEGDTWINGYWQTEKYFMDIREIILDDLRLKKELSLESKKILEEISNSNSISLHVRRGDYVTEAKTNAFHGTCSESYYVEAVSKVSKSGVIKIFVFSDDIKWCKENLKFPHSTVYVNERSTIPDYEELILMSKCKHNIIANSSFSWWGAWLNTNNDKMVIAPKKWFSNSSIDTRDVIPETWIKI